MSAEQGTSSAPVFLQTIADIEARLANEQTPAALAMKTEAKELADRFREWQRVRPTNEEKVASIQRLFELQRRAMDYRVAPQRK